MTSMLRRLAAPAVTVTLALALSACGGDDEDPGVATLDGSDTPTSAAPDTGTSSAEDDLIAFVECLRGEGIDVPDPTVDADGNLVLGEPDASDDVDLTDLPDALDACGPVPISVLSTFGGDLTQLQDSALAFAECMRGEDLDFPDPDFSQGLASAAEIFGEIDLSDPDFQAAAQTCRSAFQAGQ